MFVSAWEEDEDGIEEKNMEDPKEQFLTAAEEGNLEKLKELIQKYPDFLHVSLLLLSLLLSATHGI